jgi:hypothetical protein
MTLRSLTAAFAVVVLVLAGVPAASTATFTCSTVARKGTLDPDNASLTNRFADPAVNGQGDVVFVGSTTSGGTRKLYLYPASSAASVVAAAGDAAPGGGTFRKFTTPSINDDSDLSFVAELVVGDALFVRESGGPVVNAARTGGAAPLPGGGSFESFYALSRINAAGDLAFVADVTGGPEGVFLYDTSAATVLSVARAGDATGDGRVFCEFLDVGLGDSGLVAFTATSKLDCADLSETARLALHHQSGASFVLDVQNDDPTPVVTTTYDGFFDVYVNAADKIGFRAKAVGPLFDEMGVFLFDPMGSSTTALVVTGSPAPGTGGSLKTIPNVGITDADRTVFRGRVLHGSARHGIFFYDGGSDAAVLDTDPVPNDLYGAGASYRQIEESAEADRSGTWITYTAKVRDTAAPRIKSGVFRCVGS